MTGNRQDGVDKECFEVGVAFETGCARGQGTGDGAQKSQRQRGGYAIVCSCCGVERESREWTKKLNGDACLG